MCLPSPQPFPRQRAPPPPPGAGFIPKYDPNETKWITADATPLPPAANAKGAGEVGVEGDGVLCFDDLEPCDQALLERRALIMGQDESRRIFEEMRARSTSLDFLVTQKKLQPRAETETYTLLARVRDLNTQFRMASPYMANTFPYIVKLGITAIMFMDTRVGDIGAQEYITLCWVVLGGTQLISMPGMNFYRHPKGWMEYFEGVLPETFYRI